MPQDDRSLTVALLVVIIAQAVTLIVTGFNLWHQSRQSERQRQEARRAEWKSYLIHLMEHLIEARRDYEQFLCTDKSDESRHGGIVGMAIAVCLGANDKEMLGCVDGDDAKKMDGLTPYFVPAGRDNAREDWESRNRKAMQEAVKRLAKMIKDA